MTNEPQTPAKADPPAPTDPPAAPTHPQTDGQADASGEDTRAVNTDATPSREDGPQDLEQVPIDEADAADTS